MARATLNTIQRMIYENLGITINGSYSTASLQTNERYPSGYINDKIVEADISIIKLLAKNKQDSLIESILSTTTGILEGGTVPQNWHVIKLVNSNTAKEMQEIPYEELEKFQEGGIYSAAVSGDNYYSIEHGKLFLYSAGGFAPVQVDITYLDLTHPTTLSTLLCPSGFESAIANLASSLLLMKRGDKPEQSKFYYDMYSSFMQEYLLPDNNIQDLVDKQ